MISEIKFIPFTTFINKYTHLFKYLCDVDNEFLNDFKNMIEKNTCCIDYKLQIDYGIYDEKSLNKNMARMLSRYKNNIDYTVEIKKQKKNNISYDKKIYYLTPELFRKLTLKSQSIQSEVYANSILELEKATLLYIQYQKIEMLNKYEKNIEA